MCRRVVAVLMALGGVWSGTAHASPPEDHDFYLSVLGDSGLELFSDERLFTLFAAFNALGYDAGPVARQEPVARPELTPLRAQMRTQLQMSVGLQKKFQEFFDAHPLPRDAYAAYVLSLGPSPSYAQPSLPKDLASLNGFDKLLAAYDAEAHVAQAYVGIAESLRTVLKATLAQVEPLTRDADKLLPQAPPPSIALNVLDDSAALGIVGTGVDFNALAGAPSGTGKNADLSGVVAAYAAAKAFPIVASQNVPSGVGDLVQRVHKRGLPAGNLTPAIYVAQSYGAAVAAAVFPPRRQAILAAADARGLWLASDLDHMLNDEHGKTAPEELLGGRLAALDYKRIAPAASP